MHFYAIAPSLSFEIINALLDNAYLETVPVEESLNFASSAVVLGFMIKLGAAPVHQ